jgi:hypothetical protein
MSVLNINLKVNEATFDKIINENLKIVRHGYSKNKKFTRLLLNEINEITVIASKSLRTCTRYFQSIIVTELNDKKIYEMTFK